MSIKILENFKKCYLDIDLKKILILSYIDN